MITIRYLIWDVDGTLFDTYPAFERAMADALAALGARPEPGEIAPLLRDSLSEAARQLALRHHLDPEALQTGFGQRYHRLLLRSQPPFPGAVELCAGIVDRGGANYIVTHRGRASLDRLLAAFGMADLFADAICADEGYPRKPDPAAFLALIERHGLSPAQGLAVGDRPIDVLAGQAAGLRACLFGPDSVPDLRPDYHVQSMADLHALLFPDAQVVS
jgi:phosphoglycolate phosphatase-like HAD superfamily hydrolase